jgi:hypothetical protein
MKADDNPSRGERILAITLAIPITCLFILLSWAMNLYPLNDIPTAGFGIFLTIYMAITIHGSLQILINSFKYHWSWQKLCESKTPGHMHYWLYYLLILILGIGTYAIIQEITGK